MLQAHAEVSFFVSKETSCHDVVVRWWVDARTFKNKEDMIDFGVKEDDINEYVNEHKKILIGSVNISYRRNFDPETRKKPNPIFSNSPHLYDVIFSVPKFIHPEKLTGFLIENRDSFTRDEVSLQNIIRVNGIDVVGKIDPMCILLPSIEAMRFYLPESLNDVFFVIPAPIFSSAHQKLDYIKAIEVAFSQPSWKLEPVYKITDDYEVIGKMSLCSFGAHDDFCKIHCVYKSSWHGSGED